MEDEHQTPWFGNKSTNQRLENNPDNNDLPLYNFASIRDLSEDEQKIFFKYTNCGIPLDQLFAIFVEIAGKDEATFSNIIESMTN